MRNAAAQVKKDDALGSRREMGRPGGERIGAEDGRGFVGQQLRNKAGQEHRSSHHRAQKTAP
jgi:hypothetical protein